MNTHGPIQAELIALMNGMAKAIDETFKDAMGQRWGFALLVFPFGETLDHRMNYISNSHREDMIAACKEFVARNEGRMTAEPKGKQ